MPCLNCMIVALFILYSMACSYSGTIRVNVPGHRIGDKVYNYTQSVNWRQWFN